MTNIAFWISVIWCAVISQVGIFALGYVFGSRIKRELDSVFDRIDGKEG